MRKSLLVTFIISITLFAACDKSIKPGDDVTGEIKIDGSSTVYPLTEAMAEEFRMDYRKVRVTIGLSGTGGGFKKFSRGETDINNASRPIKDSEIQACKESNITYTGITVAFDGLAIVINPKNTWAKDITIAELKKLWEPEAQGKIKTWNQVRASWPNEEIHLFGAGVESGTYDYFTEAVVGEAHKSRGDYTASEDDNVLVQGVSTDKNALGFFGLAYYEENAGKLKLLPVDNGSGPITPTVETIKNKTYSPLSRPLLIYVNSKAAVRKEVQLFIDFYLENASILAEEVGYIPLMEEEYATERMKFGEYVKGIAQ